MSTSRILIVTGQSGAGKMTAMRVLEDCGYRAVDNPPMDFVRTLLTSQKTAKEQETDDGNGKFFAGWVLGLDAREPAFSAAIESGDLIVADAQNGGRAANLDVVYLEASLPVLIRRFSETRRLHPLDRGDGLNAAMKREVDVLAPVREWAGDTLDTSHLSPQQLRSCLEARFVTETAHGSVEKKGTAPAALTTTLQVGLVSFGYKHGLPIQADVVFDVRFLTNPYFRPELRKGSGLDLDVRQFVLSQADADPFLKQAAQMLLFLVPRFQREGKRYLTVALGCTGGQHRSVALVEALAEMLKVQDLVVAARHRDVRRKPA